MPPLSWGSDKENFYCLKEGVTAMQLLVDHSELTHQMLENLYLMTSLACYLPSLVRTPPMFVVPVLLTPFGGTAMQATACSSGYWKFLARPPGSGLGATNHPVALRFSTTTFLPIAWSR